jgi:hypothetical protein
MGAEGSAKTACEIGILSIIKDFINVGNSSKTPLKLTSKQNSRSLTKVLVRFGSPVPPTVLEGLR